MYFAGIGPDSVDIWDYQTEERLTSLKLRGERVYGGFICWSSDCRRMITSASLIPYLVMWDVRDINDCKEMYNKEHRPEYAGNLRSACFMRNNEQFVVAFGGMIGLHDVESGQLVRIADIRGDFAGINFLQAVDDKILTAAWDGVVTVWDTGLVDFQRLLLETRVSYGCLHPSGDMVLFALEDTKKFVLVDLRTLSPVKTFGQGSILSRGSMVALHFNNTGSRLIAQRPRFVSPNVHVYDFAAETLLFEFSSVAVVCYSADSSRIYGCTSDKRLVYWDADTGAEHPCPFSNDHPKYYGLYVVFPANSILM
jgi:WD40 repeat protein